MASYSSASNSLNLAQSNYRALLLRVEEIRQDVESGAGVSDIANNYARVLNQIQVQLGTVQNLQDVIIPDINDASQNKIEALYNLAGELRDNLNNLDTEMRQLLRQARQNDNNRDLLETVPKNSAGEIVSNEQDARDNDANIQAPPQEDVVVDQETGRVVSEPENTNTGTNARTPNTEDDVDSNTDSAVGNEASGGATSSVGGDRATVEAERTQPGDVAASDDEVTDTPSTVGTSTGAGDRPEVASEFLDPIESRANILSGISSMTYGLSWYLMNPEEFADFVIAEDKILPSSQLLVQSAGAPEAERNEWFNVDFYIENFTLDSVVGTQAVGSPHNAVTLEFDVVEPQGITLLNRLNNAVIDHLGPDTTVSQARADGLAQSYLMVIRFYGYDGAGNLVTASDLGLPATTDANAIQEKFIPFVITGFGYKIATKATEYKISGACVGTNIAFSTARGAIPFNIQLTASTIDQLFNGNKVLTNTQDEEQDESQSGTTQTVVQGLTQALNDQQQRMAGESAEIPDEYEIVFQDPALRNAKIVKPGKVSKTKASNLTAEQAARKYLTSKLNYDKESQTYNVLAGTQIVQLIDLLLRTSSYVTSQQDIYIDEKTGQPVGPEDPNGVPRSVPTVQWYRVKTQVVPLGYDRKRRTVAYKITYLINKYQINSPRSAYFPNSEYRGVHKLYNYWFTGQNTEVLDFEINVDKNFFMVIGNDGRIDNRDPGMFGGTQIYSSAPGQSLQGGERGSSVPAANLSDRLYSFADVATAELDIVGDPDWIQQNEIVYNRSLTLEPFAPDGSVNFDASEVLFELRFNPVADYDLATGLSNVYENNRDISIGGPNGNITQPNAAQESIIWCATTVTSMFREGSFTQRLSGVYRPLESSKNAPVNPQAQVVLSDGNTVEQALAERERETVFGFSDNPGAPGGDAGTRTLGRSTPKTGVETKPNTKNEIVVEIVPNDQFPDDDAGTETR